jgi:hypothetical protein
MEIPYNYTQYSYSFYPNATITSNRSNRINSNITNKNGLIADNKATDILFNISASIRSNTLPSNWYYFPITPGSIISNNLEGVIYDNEIGTEGIKYNTSLDIISNECYGILNNRAQAIVSNRTEKSATPYETEQIISGNIVNKDIINNYTGSIINNIVRGSIWNNNLISGNGNQEGGSSCKIINNTANSIHSNI